MTISSNSRAGANQSLLAGLLSIAQGVRRICIAAAIAVAAGAPAYGQVGQDAALGDDVQGLLTFARQRSPELRAMREEAEAAAQRVAPAGALADPVLRVELMNINNYGSGAAPSLLPSKVGETKYTLMQQLPLWGKRELKRDAAAADVRQAEARANATWAELSARIKTAYAESFRAVGNEQISAEVLGLMTRLEQVAQVRYASGLVPQADAIRAQLEQTAMRSELIMLDSEKRQVKARLNALLARESNAVLADAATLRALPALTTSDAPALA